MADVSLLSKSPPPLSLSRCLSRLVQLNVCVFLFIFSSSNSVTLLTRSSMVDLFLYRVCAPVSLSILGLYVITDWQGTNTHANTHTRDQNNSLILTTTCNNIKSRVEIISFQLFIYDIYLWFHCLYNICVLCVFV